MNLNQDHRFLNAFRKKYDVIEIIMKYSSAQHQSAYDAILCANRSHDDVLQGTVKSYAQIQQRHL